MLPLYVLRASTSADSIAVVVVGFEAVADTEDAVAVVVLPAASREPGLHFEHGVYPFATASFNVVDILLF